MEKSRVINNFHRVFHSFWGKPSCINADFSAWEIFMHIAGNYFLPKLTTFFFEAKEPNSCFFLMKMWKNRGFPLFPQSFPQFWIYKISIGLRHFVQFKNNKKQPPKCTKIGIKFCAFCHIDKFKKIVYTGHEKKEGFGTGRKEAVRLFSSGSPF